PYIISQHSATWRIGKYLNELLRPFVDKILSTTTTFRGEPDFMYQLYDHIFTKHELQSTTLFYAIKITNYYTLNTHKNMIDIVGYFLEDNLVPNKLEQVTIQNIKNLLHIFLYNNVFYYKDQIYTLTKGSPNTMPLSDTLSNIYVFKLIASSVPFLHAFVQNQNGNLFSRIYRHPLIQSYSLPYEVGHAKLVHSDWLRSVLIRAVCYYSSVEDFNLERIYLELTCLTKGYSLRFVETHVQHFFNFFHLHPMRYSRDQIMYNKFRHNWFNYIKIQHELSDQLQQFDDKVNNYEIYLINQSTSPMLLHNSSELASKTTEFTIDTKHHYYATTINSVIGSNRTFTASVRDAILVDKIAYNGNHELQEQATEKEQHKTTLSVETKGTLSLYDADPYLEDNNSMNNMMIIGSPLSQPLNFDTME
ncbi:unnamed protein product, partial [Rotaria magnacalcarata]